MAQQVMECSGSNAAIRSSLDLVSNAGRITLTGWPPRETSIPTDIITRKEIDIRGARTSAGEFQNADVRATSTLDNNVWLPAYTQSTVTSTTTCTKSITTFSAI